MAGSFDREDLTRLFDELAAELAKTRTKAQIYIVGGAVMTLEHTRVRSTDDIDAKLGEGRYFVRDAAKRIAERHGLTDDWLNEYVVADRIKQRGLGRGLARVLGSLVGPSKTSTATG